MNEKTDSQGGEHYWDDPAYRYVSRKHREAVDAGDAAGAERFDQLMQQLAAGTVPDEIHDELADAAKVDRRERKAQRKRQQSHPPPATADHEPAPSVNVADLKRRIYNPHVSRENVIKALEALPSAERKATIAGLPPGLRRKLGDYLTGRKH